MILKAKKKIPFYEKKMGKTQYFGKFYDQRGLCKEMSAGRMLCVCVVVVVVFFFQVFFVLPGHPKLLQVLIGLFQAPR